MDVYKAAYISYLNSPYAIQKAKKFENVLSFCYHFILQHIKNRSLHWQHPHHPKSFYLFIIFKEVLYGCETMKTIYDNNLN